MADDDRVLGEHSAEEIAAYLREIGDAEAAERFEAAAAAVRGQGARWDAFLGKDQWAYSGLVVGYVEPGKEDRCEISDANAIEADPSLKGARVKITLDGFFVQSYPGNGRHRILCEFSGQNQVAGETEELKFALTLEAMDGQGAGIQGKPIFMGATVGDDGLSFRGETVNISSDDDNVVLDALNGEAFKSGLSLVASIQPALKPFVGLAASIVKAAAGRSRNKKVFKFDLGLDFNQGNLSARLRRGSYIIVQRGGGSWRWPSFSFARSTRQVHRTADDQLLELNYLVISVDDFEGEAAPQKVPTRAARRAAG